MDKEPSMGATDEADRLAAVVNDPSGQVCYRKAFARFIDHVSEVAKEWLDAWECGKLAPITTRDKTKPFILPDPEPDVLADAIIVAIAGFVADNCEKATELSALQFINNRTHLMADHIAAAVRKVQP